MYMHLSFSFFCLQSLQLEARIEAVSAELSGAEQTSAEWCGKARVRVFILCCDKKLLLLSSPPPTQSMGDRVYGGPVSSTRSSPFLTIPWCKSIPLKERPAASYTHVRQKRLGIVSAEE